MSVPYEHPAELMWQAYDLLLDSAERDGEWKDQCWRLFEQCMAADQRLWKLKDLHNRATGLPLEEEGRNVATILRERWRAQEE